MNINLLSDNNDFKHEIFIESLKEANDQINDLQVKLDDYKWLDNALIERTHLLDKRDRELNCIFKLIETIKKNKNNYNNVFQLIANIIPEGFQNPELMSVLLKIKNLTFNSVNFSQSSNYHLSKKNDKNGNEITLQVFLNDKNNMNNFFLSEEINLINHILDLLCLILGK